MRDGKFKMMHMTFKHDYNCPTLFSRNLAECNCRPEIQLEESTDEKFSAQKIKDDFERFKKIKAKYN